MNRLLLAGLARRRPGPSGMRAFFSVTMRADAKVKAAIVAIGEDAWTPIKYIRAIWDDQLAGPAAWGWVED